jgi:hypothetical protein
MKEIEEVGHLTDSLIEDVKGLIAAGRTRVANTVSQELVLLHWRIGSE